MNPFSGQKALYHVGYWAQMLTGDVPPPVLVTLDPVGRCNLKCVWCNGEAAISKRGGQYDDATIDGMPRFLADWGVRAVCIAGGGEPLLHPRLGDLVVALETADVAVGIVTNGLCIDRHLSALGACRWIGVSVDAGTADTYSRLKGADAFWKVCDSIHELVHAWPGLEVNYKYLIHPENIGDIVEAARTAKKLGCRYFHARPAGVDWWSLSERRTLFTQEQVARAAAQMADAGKLTGDGFEVVGTFDKFSGSWGITHPFRACYAVGMTCVISPDKTVGLCCDRRGDDRTQLCRWEKLDDIKAAWGGGRHRQVLGRVNLNECPRCTYVPHNSLFEEFAIRDASCRDFI